MNIIAVDPGKTCGMFELTDATFAHSELEPYDLVRMLDLSETPWITLVVERYTQQSLKLTPQYDALETIGALRYVARRNNWMFTLQSRSQKSRVRDDALRELGWHKPGMSHANDAARHALIFLARQQPNHRIIRRIAGMI